MKLFAIEPITLVVLFFFLVTGSIFTVKKCKTDKPEVVDPPAKVEVSEAPADIDWL